MADTTYTPTFKHVDWVDNEDVVEAGGENGFNARFHALETEFARLSKVIDNINAAIVPVSRTITLTPALGFFPSDTTSGVWSGTGTATGNAPSASGWMPIQLPDGARVESMTMFGERLANKVSGGVDLFRSSLDATKVDRLTQTSFPDAPVRFKVKGEVPADLSLVDNSSHIYYLTVFAKIEDPGSQMFLTAIQIVCKVP